MRIVFGRILGLLSTLVASGCVTTAWVKPGATEAEFNQDRYACAQSAFQSAPANMQSMSTLGQPVQSKTSCTQTLSGMDCTTRGPEWYEQYQVDVNAETRDQLFGMCMSSKGWSLQEIKSQERSPASSSMSGPSTTPSKSPRSEARKTACNSSWEKRESELERKGFTIYSFLQDCIAGRVEP